MYDKKLCHTHKCPIAGLGLRSNTRKIMQGNRIQLRRIVEAQLKHN